MTAPLDLAAALDGAFAAPMSPAAAFPVPAAAAAAIVPPLPVPRAAVPAPAAVPRARAGAGPRRSSRERKATGVWVDGHFVKNANMYDLEGGERSVWDQELNRAAPPAWAGVAPGASRSSAAPKARAPRAPSTRAPRVPSAAEQRRAAHGALIKAAKAAAIPRRARFVEARAALFEPFNGRTAWCAAAADPSPRRIVPPFTRTPDYVNADMRPYQLDGLRFLAQSYEDGVSAILADEMGLGKTLQTLSFLRYLLVERKVSGPFLVICPLSVLSSWLVESSKFTPELRAVKLHSADAAERERLKSKLRDVDSYDLVVTTFEMAKSPGMQSTLASTMWWRYVVLDEGHIIKNDGSDVSKSVRKLHFEHALLLTGTPLQNDLHELWALLNFLFPDLFPESAAFDAAFDRNGGHAAGAGGGALASAHALMGCLMLRRVKREVEKKLPPKITYR